MSPSPPPVTIGAVIRHGRIFDPKNRDNSRVDDLPGNVMELLALLEERTIRYAIAGAIAVLSYVEGRNTQDLDLILRPADLARIRASKSSTETPISLAAVSARSRSMPC